MSPTPRSPSAKPSKTSTMPTRDQARRLRDVNDELKNAELNTESAAISVARAKEKSHQDQAQYAKGEASALDVREADLRVRTSMQSYQRLKQNAADTRIKAAETNEKGIENGDIVKSKREGPVGERERHPGHPLSAGCPTLPARLEYRLREARTPRRRQPSPPAA